MKTFIGKGLLGAASVVVVAAMTICASPASAQQGSSADVYFNQNNVHQHTVNGNNNLTIGSNQGSGSQGGGGNQGGEGSGEGNGEGGAPGANPQLIQWAKNTSLCMASTGVNDAGVILKQCNAADQLQLWYITFAPVGGAWKIQNVASSSPNLCIEADKGYNPDVRTKDCGGQQQFPNSQYFTHPTAPGASTGLQSVMYNNLYLNGNGTQVTLGNTIDGWFFVHPAP